MVIAEPPLAISYTVSLSHAPLCSFIHWSISCFTAYLALVHLHLMYCNIKMSADTELITDTDLTFLINSWNIGCCRMSDRIDSELKLAMINVKRIKVPNIWIKEVKKSFQWNLLYMHCYLRIYPLITYKGVGRCRKSVILFDR